MQKGCEIVGTGDKEYLYELALILDSAEGQVIGDEHFIRIDVMTARDIASRLRLIASRMNTILH